VNSLFCCRLHAKIADQLKTDYQEERLLSIPELRKALSEYCVQALLQKLADQPKSSPPLAIVPSFPVIVCQGSMATGWAPSETTPSDMLRIDYSNLACVKFDFGFRWKDASGRTEDDGVNDECFTLSGGANYETSWAHQRWEQFQACCLAIVRELIFDGQTFQIFCREVDKRLNGAGFFVIPYIESGFFSHQLKVAKGIHDAK